MIAFNNYYTTGIFYFIVSVVSAMNKLAPISEFVEVFILINLMFELFVTFQSVAFAETGLRSPHEVCVGRDQQV